MRAHVSLNVKEVKESVGFYSKLFGATPQKQTSDYAKFDLQHPALNLSLQPSPLEKRSRVNHFGIEVDSSLAVEEWRRRLETLGLTGEVEQSVSCCYARQDKVWFKDPDGNSWEIFYVHEQLPVLGQVSAAGTCCIPMELGSCCSSQFKGI
ncbi:MAG TPA: ArsI/CadI family heavy metal resistance metalloenzyme [bacterium]